MQTPYNFKKIVIAAIMLFFMLNTAMAQVPPAGKYNTSNYPEDRKAIEALGMLHDSTIHLNDDYIAVGPEGKVSYGYAEWKKGFDAAHAAFKSVAVVPGTYVLRIYNGDAAVKTMVLDVVFSTPGGDMPITVIRTETYIKQNGKWYFVSGQGTRKMSIAEQEGMGNKEPKKN